MEVQAFLIGDAINPQLTVIDSVEYAPEYAYQTKTSVSWYVRDYELVKRRAEGRGKRIVGFIHSHPRWDAVMSTADHKFCLAHGYRVCGIVSTHKRATRVRFWVMDSSLPCEVAYAKKKATSVGHQPATER